MTARLSLRALLVGTVLASASGGCSSGSRDGENGSDQNSGTAPDANAGGTEDGDSGAGGTGAANTGATGSADASASGGSTSGTSAGGASTGGTTTSGTSTGGTSTGGVDAGGGSSGALTKFSFFVTSLSAMRQLSKSQNGFGGDLRFGETGDGAGLRGADKICSTIAEMSMPGAAQKQWHAFLSTATVNAKDRIGTGPWYDRQGRLVAQDLAALLKTRPMGADVTIINDLPNETGVPNQAGSAEGSADDNHDTVTATKQDGTFDGGGTCSDFTSTTGTGPRLGHSWPAQSGQSWTTAHKAPGCAASVSLVQNGAGSGDGIGNGGGYGGIYCLALMP